MLQQVPQTSHKFASTRIRSYFSRKFARRSSFPNPPARARDCYSRLFFSARAICPCSGGARPSPSNGGGGGAKPSLAAEQYSWLPAAARPRSSHHAALVARTGARRGGVPAQELSLPAQDLGLPGQWMMGEMDAGQRGEAAGARNRTETAGIRRIWLAASSTRRSDGALFWR